MQETNQSKIASVLAGIAVEPDDREEIRLQKALLVSAVAMIIAAAAILGLIYSTDP